MRADGDEAIRSGNASGLSNTRAHERTAALARAERQRVCDMAKPAAGRFAKASERSGSRMRLNGNRLSALACLVCMGCLAMVPFLQAPSNSRLVR